MGVNLKNRSHEEELMDDLKDDSQDLYRALRELDIINQWLGGNKITINAVISQIKNNQQAEWSIADLGCGSGELLIRIAKWCRKHHIQIKLYGYDANATVVAYAKNHCKNYPEIQIEQVNICEADFKAKEFDVILCTLFLHHFKDEELINLLNQFRSQSNITIINDLHRYWFAYYSIKWITKLFSRSKMVKNDACLSVWRAFTYSDWVKLLTAAEINHYRLKWRWAFRWELIFGKNILGGTLY